MWLLLLLVIVFLAYLNSWLKYDQFERIPGPPGLFILGNALDFLMDPVKTFYRFRLLANKYKDLFKFKLGPKRFVVIYNPEDIELVTSAIKHSNKGFVYSFLEPWLKEGLLLSKGAKWQHRRKILTPTFHFNILRHFHSALQKNSWKFAEQLQPEVNKLKTEISPFIKDFTLHSICETAMGTKLDQQTSDSGKQYKDSIQKFGECVVYRTQRIWMYPDLIYHLTDVGRKQKQKLDLLSSFSKSVIDKRRETGESENLFINEYNGDTLPSEKKRLAMLDLLLNAERDGIIDSKGIEEEVDTFMFEGHDTTATALQFTFMLLANHPEAQDRIVEECRGISETSSAAFSMNDLAQMKYLECCIKESMRLYPPVHFIIRRTTQPLKLKNYEVPVNTDCVILIYDLHRRSDQFVEPLQFQPERFLVETPTWHPYSYIPFSAGPRNCIGQKFAMIEMKLAISAVLRRYRLLPVTKPEDIIFTTDIILRSKDPIYVKIEDRY